MFNLYMDEDSIHHALTEALRSRGMDVLTALDADFLERDDEEQLEYATTLGRVLFTFNVRDFYQLHARYLAEGRSHAGIILAPQQRHSIAASLDWRDDAGSIVVDRHAYRRGHERSRCISQSVTTK